MEDNFFKELVSNLAFITKVKYVFLTKCLQGDESDCTETVVFWAGNSFVDNIRYTLHGTPCEDVQKGNLCFYSERIQALFPDDKDLEELGAESYIGYPMISSFDQTLGHIAMLDTVPLKNEQELTTIIKAFASLASLEFERVQTLQILSEQEALNSIVLENSLDAFIAIDTAGKIIKWNKQAEEIFAWSETEVTGRLLEKFIVPRRERTAYRNCLKKVSETGESQIMNRRMEINAQHREGHAFPVELTIIPVRVDNTIVSFSAFIRDLTKKKKQETLRQAELSVLEMIAQNKPQKEIFEYLCIAMEKQFSTQAYASVLLVNEGSTSLVLGAAPSFNQQVQEALDGLLIGECHGSCAAAVFRKEPVFVIDVQTDPIWEDFREFTKEHHIKACWSMPFYSDNGEVLGSFALTHSIRVEPTESDIRLMRVAAQLAGITFERFKSQAALFASEEKFTKALEVTPDAVVITRMVDGKIIEVNDACIKLSGYQRDEIIGKTTLELNFYSAAERKKLISVLTEEGKYVDYEFTITRKDGTIRNVMGSFVVLEIDDELCLFAIIHDMTKRKRAEELLSDKNQTLKALNLCNHELLHADDEQSLLDAICKIIVETGGFQTAGVGIAEHDENKTIRFVAQYGDDHGYLKQANINWRDDNEYGCGPVGVTIRTGQAHIVHDVKTEPCFEPWRKAALKSGYASIVTIPLMVEGNTLGAMLVYSSEMDDFDKEKLALLDSLANNLAYGMQVLRVKHERQITQAALHESEEKYSKALELSPDAVVITRLADGRMIEANEACLKLSGYERGEIIGKTTLELNIYDADEREKIVSLLKRDGKYVNFESILRRKDGQWVNTLSSAVVLEIKGELCIFAIIHDITERKKRELVLSENEGKLRSAFETSPDAIAITTLEDGIITEVNGGFIKTSGYCREELIGKTIVELNIWPEKEDRQKFTKILKGKGSFSGLNVKLRCKNGDILPILISASIIYSGSEPYIFTVSRDMSDIQDSSDKLERANWLLELEKKSLEQISSGLEPGKILKELIVSIEERYADISCSVSLLVDEGQYLVPCAASRLPKEYIKEMGQIKIGSSVGSCGTAAFHNKNVFVSDIATDPLWKNYRNLAGKYGLCACWSMPIASVAGYVYGAIAIYYKEPKEADKEHIELLEHIRKVAEVSFEQYKSKNELLQSENRYRALYDGTPSIFFTINQDNLIVSVNEFGAEKLGYRVDELMGCSTLDIVLPEDRKHYETSIEICFSDHEKTHNWEIRKVKKSGIIIWSRESARVINDVNGVQKLLIVSEDITEAHKLSQQLSYQASHDALTGLVNRREFEIRLERLIHEDGGNTETHALCYLDLDQFKVINDTCGHLAGDELLRQLGELLKTKVRKKDTLARLGGDEFGVLMENCSLGQAQRVAKNLRELVEEFQFVWTDKRFSIGVSIGLVPIDDRGRDPAEILSAADAACYAAKDAGRNRVHVYHTKDNELAVHRGEMQWVSRINHALEEERLRLYLQPIVSLSKKKNDKKHYECLMRMVDENGKIIPPGAFLPAAERYDLSTKLDRWVFDSVYDRMAKHHKKYKELMSYSVNISGHSLSNEGFLNYIVSKLDEDKIIPSNICFEITETVAISRLSNAIRFMEVLKSKGCFFALDDFGSGVSSFGYLKNLPVDFLKIDGMFVRDMVGDPIDFEMVRSINEIGHVMGKKTIAEFVENAQVLDRLKALGVDYAQGYYMGKPRAVRVSGLRIKGSDELKKNRVNKKRTARTRKTD